MLFKVDPNGLFQLPLCCLLDISSSALQEKVATVTSGSQPSLLYDYYGFPEEAYKIKYDAPGSPKVAQRVANLLQSAGLSGNLDSKRGWDHGVFVPLKLLYPAADIPVVVLSMLNSLSAEVSNASVSARCDHDRLLACWVLAL